MMNLSGHMSFQFQQTEGPDPLARMTSRLPESSARPMKYTSTMSSQIDTIQGLISTDLKPTGFASDSSTEIPARKSTASTVFKIEVTIGLAGFVAAAWMTTGVDSVAPYALLLALLVTIVAFSTELLLADECELAQWGWALYMEHGAVQISTHAALGQAAGVVAATLPFSSMVHDDSTRLNAVVGLKGFCAED